MFAQWRAELMLRKFDTTDTRNEFVSSPWKSYLFYQSYWILRINLIESWERRARLEANPTLHTCYVAIHETIKNSVDHHEPRWFEIYYLIFFMWLS